MYVPNFTYYSLFISNFNFTGHPVFYMAALPKLDIYC